MADFLDVLVGNAKKTVSEGYYQIDAVNSKRRNLSLKNHILKCEHAPVIAEIKPASPSHGKLRNITNLKEMVKAIENGGAVGISVLTEPKHFDGSLKSLVEVRRHSELPILMKDIIIDPVQIETASKIGANAILLIASTYKRAYTNHLIHEMIEFAHAENLEVLLETHNKEEFLSALETEADLIGINNRNLQTLSVDLKVTQKILSEIGDCDRVVVSESGIQNPADIQFLRKCGAHAFLVGSAIMLANDIEAKMRELVTAL
ncbi:MAG: indole-3-glycerol-phosphate synthase [Candidatus Bathyarchaeia archaeon]